MLFPGASFSIEGLACPPTSFCLWRVSVSPILAKVLLSMHRKLCFALVALLASFLAGCSTPESRIKSNPQIYSSLSPADQTLVRQGQIRVGMSKAAVFLAWGNPDRIRSGVRQGHPFEVWIYTTTTAFTLLRELTSVVECPASVAYCLCKFSCVLENGGR